MAYYGLNIQKKTLLLKKFTYEFYKILNIISLFTYEVA